MPRITLLDVVKENVYKPSTPVNHEKEFWKHIDQHMKYFEKGQNTENPHDQKTYEKINQAHLDLAHLHAMGHWHRTGTKLDVGDGLDGFESKYVTHGS